jgi:hypothetical protein
MKSKGLCKKPKKFACKTQGDALVVGSRYFPVRPAQNSAAEVLGYFYQAGFCQ